MWPIISQRLQRWYRWETNRVQSLQTNKNQNREKLWLQLKVGMLLKWKWKPPKLYWDKIVSPQQRYGFTRLCAFSFVKQSKVINWQLVLTQPKRIETCVAEWFRDKERAHFQITLFYFYSIIDLELFILEGFFPLIASILVPYKSYRNLRIQAKQI